MPGLSDSSGYVSIAYTRMPTERTFYTTWKNEPVTGELYEAPVNLHRTRTITQFELRGVTDTYARAYVDTHSADTGWELTAKRANEAGVWNVDVTIDVRGAWTEDT